MCKYLRSSLLFQLLRSIALIIKSPTKHQQKLRSQFEECFVFSPVVLRRWGHHEANKRGMKVNWNKRKMNLTASHLWDYSIHYSSMCKLQVVTPTQLLYGSASQCSTIIITRLVSADVANVWNKSFLLNCCNHSSKETQMRNLLTSPGTYFWYILCGSTSK